MVFVSTSIICFCISILGVTSNQGLLQEDSSIVYAQGGSTSSPTVGQGHKAEGRHAQEPPLQQESNSNVFDMLTDGEVSLALGHLDLGDHQVGVDWPPVPMAGSFSEGSQSSSMSAVSQYSQLPSGVTQQGDVRYFGVRGVLHEY